jgi:polar amino acid transport system substrate-binding protein
MPLLSKCQRAIPLTFCYLRLLLSVTLLMTVLPKPAQADRDTCDSLIVGGATDLYPIAYVNSTTKQAEGIGYKLARQLGESTGIPISFKFNFPWKRTILMAQEGTLDIIVGVVLTSERSKFLHFTKPFYRDSLYAYTLQDNNIHLTRVEDLINYRRVAIRGHSEGEALDELLKSATMRVNERSQLISLILSKRADYFFNTESEFSQLQRNVTEAKNIKKLPLAVTTLEARLAVSKVSPCAKHLKEINRFITQFYSLEQ